MILDALYVCLHAFSLCQESPDLDPARQTAHFLGGSVTVPQGPLGAPCNIPATPGLAIVTSDSYLGS
jgi:hypothetical protein